MQVVMKPPFVTVSASYGARGSEIGPAVAERLGVPFFDRAISAQAADALGTSLDDPLLRGERPSGFLQRLLAGLEPASLLVPFAGVPPLVANVLDESDYRVEIERIIRGASDGPGGGVLLGRAGAVVLAGHPRALHVRLDGPPARRVQTIQQEQGIDMKQASKTLLDNDGAREAYVKQLYGADAKDPSLYHLTIDATIIPTAACIDLIVLAAHARNQDTPTPGGPSTPG